MLFRSSPNLHSPLPTNQTLVNIHEAADTTITALPAPYTTNTAQRKISAWDWLLAKVKELLMGRKEAELQIGGPTDFQHHETGGAEPLRSRGVNGGQWESEWEEVEDKIRAGI
jgi:hypothetical protein